MISAEGAFDYGAKQGSMAMSIQDPDSGQRIEIQMVFAGLVIYERLPSELASQLPGGKAWIKLDLEALGSMTGVDLGSLADASSSDPTQALQFLEGASGEVTKVGTDTIRGDATTHYRATLDLEKAAEGLSADARTAYEQAVKGLGTTTLPADVWIDTEGRLRRMEYALDESAFGASAAPGALDTVRFAMELYDFGVPVSVETPDPSEVTDLSELLGGLASPGA
jgi:hypothetical protein